MSITCGSRSTPGCLSSGGEGPLGLNAVGFQVNVNQLRQVATVDMQCAADTATRVRLIGCLACNSGLRICFETGNAPFGAFVNMIISHDDCPECCSVRLNASVLTQLETLGKVLLQQASARCGLLKLLSLSDGTARCPCHSV